MIKINWNEFVIGCGIPLGGAVLASLFFSGNTNPDSYRNQKTNSKKQNPKGKQEINDVDLDESILNNDLEDFNDDYLEYPEDQLSIYNEAIEPEITAVQASKNSVTTEIPESPVEDIEVEASLLIPLPKADEFPLRLGSKGKRVWEIRSYLLRYHGADGIISDELTSKAQQQIKKYLKVTAVDEDLFNKLIHPGKIIAQWKT